MTAFAADDGPRLLRGGPIAAVDPGAGRGRRGRVPRRVRVRPGPGRRGRGQGRAVRGLPAQDPRRLPPGGHRGPPRRAARGRRRGRHRRRAARPPGRLARRRDHHPDAAPAGHRAQGGDRRPGPAARHRRHPPAQRRAALPRATTGSCPATAHASIEILKQSGIEIAGKHAVVVGRSNVIGKPAALLLLRENATVTVCHSKTRTSPTSSAPPTS